MLPNEFIEKIKIYEFFSNIMVTSPKVNVPVEVVPMEELEKVLSNSNHGTIVTSPVGRSDPDGP